MEGKFQSMVGNSYKIARKLQNKWEVQKKEKNGGKLKKNCGKFKKNFKEIS